MKEKDFYSVLQVSSSAEQAAIQRAYRALMRRYHPDAGWEQDAARTKQINAAYDVLSDPEKRRLYDAQRLKQEKGKEKKRPPSRPKRPTVAPEPFEAEPFEQRRGISERALFLWSLAFILTLVALLLTGP
ncbi:J domain-containing protein [Sphingomonas piscis]|uniref:J domain-containing protein n=1 Tax=Sphingomonas piscis TaxID=2714943 RepID=A0A6G7YSA2_9SPHN|nr:DnaJ domain-containing protein [Sphingomonas piscis]QIK79620.1 J domain-containing protein [Sphingomonas piscis]